MPILSVDGFSTVNEARIELAPLTLLVGPQASGKSLLSKLFYFFGDVPRLLLFEAQDGEKLRAARDRIRRQFNEWFPPSAWGSNNFAITYSAAEFECTVRRQPSGRSEPSADVDVSLSNYISSEYSWLFKEYSALNLHRDPFEEETLALRYSGPRSDIERQFYKRLKDRLGKEFVESEIFIPAGRSFFTTLGKAFAILEHAGGMNQVLSRFGSFYAFLVDIGSTPYVPSDRASRDAARASEEKRRAIMQRLFGGQLRLGNRQFLQTNDGRQIPFGLLSSGQQELLPLWITIAYLVRNREFLPRDNSLTLVFVEEPEAHLFPATQSYLIEYLASVVNDATINMTLSTHSPYVLAKINNLLKAGSLVEQGVSKKSVERIVPSSSWLRPSAIKAYAIRDGRTEDLMGEDGLISGSYLDEISGAISAEFLELLELEARRESR